MRPATRRRCTRSARPGPPRWQSARAGSARAGPTVVAPPCGEGQAYASLLDLALLAGATIVAAPVPRIQAALRLYKGNAAIVPRGTHVPGLRADRVLAVALPGSQGGSQDATVCSRAGLAGAGTGASLLVRIRVMMTSRLHRSSSAAKPNADAMPCVTTCCDWASW